MDIQVNNQGTIILLTIMSEKGKKWINKHLQTEPWQWYGPSLAIDHRMAAPILEGMRDDGLELGE